jgi:hypothetical protein
MISNNKNKVLNYTNLDFDSIRNQIGEYLAKDPRFENISDSAIAQTIIDVFAACTDLNNYYIERRAEESFLDTAKLLSSVILNSRNLAYIPKRAIPARSGLSIVLSGPLPGGVVAGDVVTFQKQTTDFIGEAMPFLLRNTYTYTFTQDDIDNGVSSDWEKTISFSVNLSGSSDSIPLDNNGDVDPTALKDIEIIQGEIKTYTILGSTNLQVGNIFQEYILDDTTFSNYYGEEDEGYNTTTDEDDIVSNFTKVEINQSVSADFLTPNNLYTVKRRVLANSTDSGLDGYVPNNVLIRSGLNKDIEIKFGDNTVSDIGVTNSNDNIHIQYLSTLGSNGNKIGVIGRELTTTDTFVTNNSVDITDNIKFYFYRNITNGSDFESIESIKINAPAVYDSLDRLVTPRNYISYLKLQTIGENGEQVKNAIAWGEQEEILERGQVANFRFFNCAFFSVIGSLYKFPSNGTYTYRNDEELLDAYLEKPEDFSTISETNVGLVSADGYPEQTYFNMFVKETPQAQVLRLEDYRVSDANHPISILYNKIKTRSQITTKTIYITPIIQKFSLKGTVRLGKLEDKESVKKKINNEVYNFLNEEADFSNKMYISEIYEIIQSFREVKNSDIYFEPIIPTKTITTWGSDEDMVNGTLPAHTASISAVYDNSIVEYLSDKGYAKIYSTLNPLEIDESLDIDNITLSGSPVGIWNSDFSNPYYFKDKQDKMVSGITERTFYTELMKNIYDGLGTGYLDINSEPFRDSQYFKNIMYKMHNDILGAIRYGMISKDGNIEKYSLKNEMVQVQIGLNYQAS